MGVSSGDWFSHDATGFEDGPNVYAYVKQNPWTAFDPEGLSSYSDLTDSAAKDLAEDRPIRGYAKAAVSSLWEAFSFGNASKMGEVEDSYAAGDITAGQAAWQATAGTATAVKDAALTYGTGGAVLKLANKYDKAETLVNVGTDLANGDYTGAALGALGEVAPGSKKSPSPGGQTAKDINVAAKTTQDLKTGVGYDAGDVPVRIEGPWSVNDMKKGLLGHPPPGLGSPDIHHGGQMPGGAKHEIIPSQHRNNSALHPNPNQGVTPEMRQSDRQLHWWYRAREQGADQILPDWIYD
jgi:hypothetical protein